MTRQERERLIEQYAAGPARLRAAWNAVPPEARQWRPEPKEWSAHEVVCHCADSESVSYGRIRMLAAEKEPLLVGYDQEHWARFFDYHNHPVDTAMATVDAVRANTTAILRRLPESAWAKVGRHTESGPYAATDWLRIYADHLEGHARQIDDNVAKWKTVQGR